MTLWEAAQADQFIVAHVHKKYAPQWHCDDVLTFTADGIMLGKNLA